MTRESGGRKPLLLHARSLYRSLPLAPLPNPEQDGSHSYVPRNMPAIGDLFDLFDFKGHK